MSRVKSAQRIKEDNDGVHCRQSRKHCKTKAQTSGSKKNQRKKR